MSNESEKVNIKQQRSDIRSAIFSNAKPKSKTLTFFGQVIEIRQPSMRELLALQMEEADLSRRAATMIVNYAYIPGTAEKVFEDTDIDELQSLPFGDDMARMQNVIAELTGTGNSAEETATKN